MIAIRDRVRFVETDMMGVVHHANYLRWFEMGRVAYLRAAGVELLDLMAHGVIFPGLDRKAFMPQSNARFRSSSNTLAVMATIGTVARAGSFSARMRWVAV